MPQAKTPEKSEGTEGNGAVADAVPNLLENAGPFVNALIAQAEELEFERHELMDKIGKNRDQLRNLDELGATTAEQGDYIETFYPQKERGERRSDDEIDATRKARENARKKVGARRKAAA